MEGSGIRSNQARLAIGKEPPSRSGPVAGEVLRVVEIPVNRSRLVQQDLDPTCPTIRPKNLGVAPWIVAFVFHHRRAVCLAAHLVWVNAVRMKVAETGPV